MSTDESYVILAPETNISLAHTAPLVLSMKPRDPPVLIVAPRKVTKTEADADLRKFADSLGMPLEVSDSKRDISANAVSNMVQAFQKLPALPSELPVTPSPTSREATEEHLNMPELEDPDEEKQKLHVTPPPTSRDEAKVAAFKQDVGGIARVLNELYERYGHDFMAGRRSLGYPTGGSIVHDKEKKMVTGTFAYNVLNADPIPSFLSGEHYTPIDDQELLDIYCNRCKSTGHSDEQCTTPSARGDSKDASGEPDTPPPLEDYCNRCKSVGHLEEQCILEDPDEEKQKQEADALKPYECKRCGSNERVHECTPVCLNCGERGHSYLQCTEAFDDSMARDECPHCLDPCCYECCSEPIEECDCGRMKRSDTKPPEEVKVELREPGPSVEATD